MSSKPQNYQTLNVRLDEVLAAMQSPDITIDEAINLYKEGAAIIESLQKYLREAENRVSKLNITAT